MKKIKGAVLVAFGAASYGILATIVKVANNAGVHTSILTFSQFLVGLLFLSIYAKVKSGKQVNQKAAAGSKLKLLLFGTSLGLTSSFYYLSIQYIPVSVGIILLMQTIWISIIWEAFQSKQSIGYVKILGAIVIIAGTLLATNIFQGSVSLNWKGLGFGFLAAVCYTISLHSSNHIATELPNYTRSKYLVAGGLLAIVLFWNKDIWLHFDWVVMLQWGAILGLFGTILPPLLFTKGIPMTGIALGGIIAAIEIPVSISSANWMLNEQVLLIQWAGVLVILVSVVIINMKSATTV